MGEAAVVAGSMAVCVAGSRCSTCQAGGGPRVAGGAFSRAVEPHIDLSPKSAFSCDRPLSMRPHFAIKLLLLGAAVAAAAPGG